MLWVMRTAHRTVTVCVVSQLIHVLPQYLSGQQAKLLSASPVDKGTYPLHVNAKYAFTGRFKQLRQLVTPQHLIKCGQMVEFGKTFQKQLDEHTLNTSPFM